MTSLHLLVCYLVIGSVLAFVTVRHRHDGLVARVGSALITIFVWPLWAPIALAPHRERTNDARASELHAALDGVVEAAAGSTFESLLAHDAVTRIRNEIDLATQRIEELRIALEQPGFDPRAAHARLVELERANASPRAIVAARLHRDGVARLVRLHQGQRLALEELGDALMALRAQFVLARVAGHGKDDIVSDLWARVEGLGAAFSDEKTDEQESST